MSTIVRSSPSTSVPLFTRGATVPSLSRGIHKRSPLPGRWTVRAKRGQSLVEFALILPILLMLVGGIIQYGVVFATKHSLIQVGRDAGRWAATQ
ncbi:MAG: TadE/TadG family type IV pilus assembly protein, partial [Candidatus Limnocylindria bacterium]